MIAKNEVLQERYRIIRQLGHGGMGAVYEARDERLGSLVALKEIIVELDNIPTEKQRMMFRRAFEREAKLLANLHHEAFPRVTDYFSEADRQFLIMELIHGDDLSALLGKNRKPFPLDDILRWLDHLLDALDYLHTQQQPIYHRDIKPQNLKVTARGKIKLLDFGIAKSVDNAGSTTTNHTFVGATLNYSPIEQILPAITPTFREFIVLKHREKAKTILSQNTDARCDLYAVGATFYHLLTNQIPVDSAKRSLEIWEGNKDPLIHPLEINSDLPPFISDFLLKALEIERENRFTSALEMQETLQSMLAEEKRRARVKEVSSKVIEESTLPLIESEHLAITEEQKTFDRKTAQAKTEKLIPDTAIISDTKCEMFSDTQSSNTQASHTQPSDTEISIIEPVITETAPIEVFNTQSSGNTSAPEITGTPYFNENLVKTEDSSSLATPFVLQENAKVSKNRVKPFWLLPTAALGILTIGGIGGGAIWLNTNASNSLKPSANTAVASPTITPTVSPVIHPEGLATPAQNVTNKENTRTALPLVTPTVVKTPAFQVPTKTPAVQKTPNQPKTNNKTDDCIYNGKCD